MRTTRGTPTLLIGLVLALTVRADQADYTTKAVAIPKSGDFVFSLLPKSFQRNPTLDMTVNTEVTDSGRLMRTVSPSAPAYYLAQSAGFKSLGSPIAGEKSPPEAELARALLKSLALNGYLPATKSGPQPSLVVIYYWGSHNKLDREDAENFPDLANKYKLERAALIGGKKYVADLSRTMTWGESLTDHTDLKEYLKYQANEDLYFVVASAYDHAALVHGQRKLIWRTTMTVNSTGVNMMESLVPVIATAAPFFGRETLEPEIAARRIFRDGHVEIGVPKVINDSAPPTKPGK
jgi:hypothetical protein